MANLRTWSRIPLFVLAGLAGTSLLLVPILFARPAALEVWLFALWLWWGFGTASVWLRANFSPPALGLLGIMLVYVLIPATIAVASNQTVFAGVDYSGGTLLALQVSTAAQCAITVGLIVAHSLSHRRSFVRIMVEATPRRLVWASLLAVGVAGVAFAVLTLTSGADLSKYVAIFGSSSYGDYFRSAIDTPSGYLSSIVEAASVCLMVAVIALNERPRRTRSALLVALAVAVAAFLVAGGGRATVAVPLIAAALLWIKVRRNNRSLPLRSLTVLAIAGILVVGGIVGLARGPNHPDITPSTLLSNEFGRGSDLFSPLAGLVETVPQQRNYLYGASYLDALTLPVPRAFWPGKPEGAIIDLTGSFANTANGESFPEYGEMYANFGVLGVVLGCLMFAVLLEVVWLRFSIRERGGAVLFIYPVLLAVMLQVFTRDYAASQLAGFAGLILATLVLQRILRVRAIARPTS